MRATYKEIPDLIKNKIPFEGSSVMATLDLKFIYRIYSYDTLIYSSKDNYFNDKKYSSTTSKIQNIIRKVLS